MNIESQDESTSETDIDLEAGSSMSDTENIAKGSTSISENNEQIVAGDVPDDKTAPSPHAKKWQQLQKFYNDQYLELFNDTCKLDDDVECHDFIETQLGAVTWQPEEKASLFSALSRFGRHEINRIATTIETKSQLEIKDYLDTLRQEEIDRQLFQAQTKNISHADIPAAIEIGLDCEAALENAADAVAAFQEQYDHTVGQSKHDLWLIDYDTAQALDEVADQQERESSVQESDSEDVDGVDHGQLFHLEKMLSLSTRVFMNSTQHSAQQHWRNMAAMDETPAMTIDVLEHFHDIVVNLLRRVIQSTLFLAQSRIRSTTTGQYNAASIVSKHDVYAALDILNMKADAWDYWTRLPRRFGFEMVGGSHEKGASDKHPLTYDQVEADLSVRKSRSRRRSMSVGSSTSSAENEYTLSEDEIQQIIAADAEQPTLASPTQVFLDDDDTDMSDYHPNEDDAEEETSSSSNDGEPVTQPTYMSRKRRREMLGMEEDDYMDCMDHIAKRSEELRLWQVLGRTPPDNIKAEAEDELGVRPRVLRKSLEDLRPSMIDFEAEWERDGRALADRSTNEVAQFKAGQKY